MGVLYVLFTTLIWSFVPILTKQLLGTFSPLWISFWRFVSAALFLAVVQRWRQRTRPLGTSSNPWFYPLTPYFRERWWLVLGGLGIAGNYVFYNVGLLSTTPAVSTLMVQSSAITLSALGVIALAESFRIPKITGTLLAFIGLVLVAWNGEDLSALLDSHYFWGNMLVLCAGLSWSAYGLAQKVLSRGRSVLDGLVPIFALAAVVSGLCALWDKRVLQTPTPLDLVILLGLGIIGTGLSYLMLARAMQRLEASTVAVICATLPLFTMLESYLLGLERLSALVLAGAALIITGVAMILVTAKEPAV